MAVSMNGSNINRFDSDQRYGQPSGHRQRCSEQLEDVVGVAMSELSKRLFVAS